MVITYEWPCVNAVDDRWYEKTGVWKIGYERENMKNLGMKKLGMKKPGYEKTWVWKSGYESVGMKNLGMKKLGYEKFGYEKPGMKKLGMKNLGMKKPGYEKPGMKLPGMKWQVWSEAQPGGQTPLESEVFYYLKSLHQFKSAKQAHNLILPSRRFQ